MKQLLSCILLLTFLPCAAQDELPESVNLPLLLVSGGYNVPGGDFAERFGRSAMIGMGLKYKTESNWLIGGDASFIFGTKVRQDSILDFMEDDQGYLLGLDGAQYNPILYLRGYRLQFTIGKVLPVLQPNPNSGLLAQLGVGFLQHKIFYDIKKRGMLPQLSKERQKSYDRLSNGWSFTQLLSYFYMSPNRMVNFHLGLEITEAFTFNRRTYNYPIGDYSQQRFDLLFGIRGAWILPFYEKRIVQYNEGWK